MHIQPSDRAILYNIAMIQQKSAELLFSLEPSKRTTEELQVAVKHAQQAVKWVPLLLPSQSTASIETDKFSTFRALAGDKSGALPYDADLADQRARYGDGLLRRAPEQVTRQEAYESEAQARVEEVRKLRAAEQERIRAAEVILPFPCQRKRYHELTLKQEERRAELAAKAAEVTAARRAAQEEARKWAEEENAREAEEEAKRAQHAEKRKKKAKDEIISGDEAVVGGEKKKRKTGGGGKKGGRKARSKSEISSEEEQEVEYDDEKSERGDGEEEETGDMIAQRKQNTLALLKAKAKAKAKARVCYVSSILENMF